MDAEFWAERWRTGQIGFHQSHIDESLKRHWPALDLAADARVFVPLCGKSLDLLWLRERGHAVVGVELSEAALQAFCMENGVAARRRSVPNFERYEAPGYELLAGDFYALDVDTLGPVAAVYDRAALISWRPERRPDYVEHLTALTSPGTQTLLIVLDYPQAQFQGPPFAVSDEDVVSLYGHHHSIERLSRTDVLHAEPRLQSRGIRELHEACYLLTRL